MELLLKCFTGIFPSAVYLTDYGFGKTGGAHLLLFQVSSLPSYSTFTGCVAGEIIIAQH